MLKFKLILSTAIVALLTACATPFSDRSTDKPDVALLQKCERYQAPAAVDFGESIDAIVDLLGLLGACADRHDKLIEYEQKRQ